MKLKKHKKEARQRLPQLGPKSFCPNCGEEIGRGEGLLPGHFVPPFLGEAGFFWCDLGPVTPAEGKLIGDVL